MLKIKKLREVMIFNQTSERSSIRKKNPYSRESAQFCAEHPVNEGRKEKDKTKGGLKVEAKASVDAQPARSGRTKAASRQFLTGGKICKCARGRPR
jgi:hypothetical protein